MPTGETTITLQDVSIQLGLRVDGRPITGRMDYNWPEECDRLHGVKPTEDLDQAGQYSWRSGALGWLYRDLCRATVPTAHDIGGCLILLQVWAWDRFPYIAPLRCNKLPVQSGPLITRWHDVFSVVQVLTHVVRQYRFSFDTMTSDQAVAPLLCFSVAEWHQPDRVLRQFGQRQQVPDASHSLSEQHGRDLRAIVNDWSVEHAPLIALWEERLEHVVTGPPLDDTIFGRDMSFIRPASHMFIPLPRKHLGHKTKQHHVVRLGGSHTPQVSHPPQVQEAHPPQVQEAHHRDRDSDAAIEEQVKEQDTRPQSSIVGSVDIPGTLPFSLSLVWRLTICLTIFIHHYLETVSYNQLGVHHFKFS
ncbi:hypothetical protein Vadar_005686 [Vaccinium darrowii]|uniref:Uncharacterized protein n=1 Tax=Vaccinium darrowii TaxID=229202 RepID=A0ACB7YTK5_9ERIC|nr:hypothetical protein Vadar_005686 [Vaccinium darrowii]